MVDEILKKIVRFKNGVIASYMNDNGILYRINYGVPVIDVKRIATNYFPNHTLAQQLFARDERELKLAAVFIDNHEETDSRQIDKWSKSFVNTEIVETVCRNLLYKATCAQSKICEWQLGSNKFLSQASWNMLSKMKDEKFIADFLAQKAINNFCHTNVQLAAIQALTNIASINQTAKTAVLQYADNLLQSTNSNIQFAGREVIDFCSFLPAVSTG